LSKELLDLEEQIENKENEFVQKYDIDIKDAWDKIKYKKVI